MPASFSSRHLESDSRTFGNPFRFNQLTTCSSSGTSSDAWSYIYTHNIQAGALTSCTGVQTNSSGVMSCTSSDERIKNDDGRVGLWHALADVLFMPPPHAFDFRSGYGPAGVHFGWFAQDVRSIEPSLIRIGPKTDATPDGELQFDRAELVPITFVAIKALVLVVALLFMWVGCLTLYLRR